MKKKLPLSATKRKIGGVCGGLGEYFGISPTIFRFIFLLLLLPGGIPGPALYILFWIFMPAPSLPSHIYFSTNLGGGNGPRYQGGNGGQNLGDDYTETIDV